MTIVQRIFLFCVAAFCGGFMTLWGDSFSHAIEPDQHGVTTTIFWFVFSAVLSSPLWFAALVPNRYASFSRVSRWTGAFLLLFHTCLFGGMVTHNLGRWLNGLEPTLSSLLIGFVATFGCLAAIVLLIWPEVRGYVKPAA